MTSTPDAVESTEAPGSSKLVAPPLPGLRMVGASDAVCIDGVCFVEPVLPTSLSAAVDQS